MLLTRPRSCWVVLLGLSLLLSLSHAEDQPAPPRPRIAVALSGGGARGLAHIGVLHWMEENHVPVDYVAGTSMGAVVGAMYATGMSPEEMRKFTQAIDWDETLLSEPSYDQLSYRRKQDRRSYEVTIPLGLRHGLSGPTGFNPGHGVGLLLDRIAFAYSTISSFDELPIPFRCVATDMLEGDAVVFGDGSLAQAVHASMALPGVFIPVELNGKTLADGGLVNNIPTDVARHMGSDVVIAVDVGTPLGDQKELQSLGGVLGQTIGVMTIDNDRRSLRQADIVVAPDLGPLTRYDYYSSSQLIEMGYQGAAHKAAVLRAFALPDKEWQRYLAARNQRKRSPQTSAEVLKIEGAGGHEEARLQEKLRKYLNGPLNTQRLETDLTRITGEGRFDSLGYEGFGRGTAPGLRILAHEKTYGPPFVDLAVNVNGSGVGDFDFAAGARFTFMDLRHHGVEWRTDVLLGSSNFVATEFYQPLGASRFFVAPHAFFLEQARNAFAGDQRIALFRDRRAGGGVDVGFNSGRRSEFRFGYQIFNGNLDALIGDAGLPSLEGFSSQIRLGYVFDGQDSPAVPSRGLRVSAELLRVLQSPSAPRAFNQLQVESSTFVPVSPKTSLFFTASGGMTAGGDAGVFQLFSLGGPFRLGAYKRDEFLGNHYALAGLGFRRELYRLPAPLGRKIYWGGWYEVGSAFDDPDAIVARHSFNAGVIAETLIGPIALSGSVSPTGRAKVNFSIGRLF